MNKFFALVITKDLKLQRIWTDIPTIITILKENEGSKVYRSSTDQEAVMRNDEITWQDVPSVDKISK